MKSLIPRLVGLLLLIFVVARISAPQNSPPEKGFVPDQETAIRVAEAVLTPILGIQGVNRQRPFHANLKDGEWIVVGYLPPDAIGGVAEMRISKKTCQILSAKIVQ